MRDSIIEPALPRASGTRHAAVRRLVGIESATFCIPKGRTIGPMPWAMYHASQYCNNDVRWCAILPKYCRQMSVAFALFFGVKKHKMNHGYTQKNSDFFSFVAWSEFSDCFTVQWVEVMNWIRSYYSETVKSIRLHQIYFWRSKCGDDDGQCFTVNTSGFSLRCVAG